MKSRTGKPSVLSWNTWWNDGLKLLGERLGIPMPSNAAADEMTAWWAEIGKSLAEEQPELRFKGPGRPPRSKTKHSIRSNEKDAERQRRSREKRPTQQVVLQPVRIGDDVFFLSEEVIASLKDFLVGCDTK
ncbi:MAG: hypothetical protein ACLP1D_10255 [Xanthobacteraceae bacterium]